jgi:hypothetical protein
VFTEYDYIDFFYQATIGGQQPPTPAETLEIMRNNIMEEYLARIRAIGPFSSAREAFLVDLTTVSTVPSSTAAPVPSPTDSSTPEPTGTPVRIRVTDFYITYVSEQNPVVEVTTAQFQDEVDVTTRYFEDYLKAMFEDETDITFLRAESALGSTLINAGIPEDRFNIYMEYDYTDLIYTADSNPPDAATSFDLLRNSFTPEFLLRYARNVTGAFATVNEVLMLAVTP